MTAELTALNQIGLTPQPNAEGYTFGSKTKSYPKHFEATAAGAANGTTIISSTLGSYGSANDDFVGHVVQVDYAANGPSGERGAPLRRSILAYSHASTKLTIEALPFQVSADDRFYLVDDGTEFVEDTGGSQTEIIDDDHDTAAADFHNGSAQEGGPYAWVRKASAISGQQLISDYDGASTLTTASFGASTAIGDFVEPIQWLEVVGGVPLSFTQPRVDRNAVTGSLGRHRGVAGLQEVSGSLELMWRGPGASRIGEPAECDGVLGAVTTVAAAPADETLGAGCTTTSVNVGSAGTAGEMWLTEAGDVCVDTTGADPFTPSPSLLVAPSSGETLYGMRTYSPAEAAQYCLKAVQWHGRGMVDELPGLLPAVSFSGALGEYLKVQVALKGAGGKRVYLDESAAAISRSTALGAKLSTVTPRALGFTRVNLDGVELEARSFNVDLGLKIELETNLTLPDRRQVVLRMDEPTFQIDLFLDSDAKLIAVKHMEGKPMRLLIQCGTTPGDPGVWAFWAYETELTSVETGDDNGAITATVQGRVTLDTTTTLPRWRIGMA